MEEKDSVFLVVVKAGKTRKIKPSVVPKGERPPGKKLSGNKSTAFS